MQYNTQVYYYIKYNNISNNNINSLQGTNCHRKGPRENPLWGPEPLK